MAGPPFLTALGTTVLAGASGFLAGTSTPAGNRLLSTVAGALVGLLATVVIPVPKATVGGTSAPPESS